MAGVGRMHDSTFATDNVVGALGWEVGVTLLGYWLAGSRWRRDHIEIILVGIVAVSVIPVVAELMRSCRRAATPAPLDSLFHRRFTGRCRGVTPNDAANTPASGLVAWPLTGVGETWSVRPPVRERTGP